MRQPASAGWWRLGRPLAVLLLCAGALSCARHAGKRATSGAMESIAAQTGANETGDRPIAIVAARAVDAAIERLTQPEQVEKLSRLMATVAEDAAARAGRAATAALTEQIGQDLGSGGDGPLAARISALAENAARTATAGALRSLAPECAYGDAACVDRRVAALSHGAAIGLAAGIKEELGLVALLVAFLAGALVVSLAFVVIHIVGDRRRPAPGRPFPAPAEQPT